MHSIAIWTHIVIKLVSGTIETQHKRTMMLATELLGVIRGDPDASVLLVVCQGTTTMRLLDGFTLRLPIASLLLGRLGSRDERLPRCSWSRRDDHGATHETRIVVERPFRVRVGRPLGCVLKGHGVTRRL